jgi:hypothetical protein
MYLIHMDIGYSMNLKKKSLLIYETSFEVDITMNSVP